MHAGLESRSLDLYLQINYTSMRKVINTKTKYSQKFAIELFFVSHIYHLFCKNKPKYYLWFHVAVNLMYNC